MKSKECSCMSQGDDFTDDQWREVDRIIGRFKGRDGALIPALTEVQEAVGYLPESVQRRVSSGLGIPLAQVYGVVTFYSFFTMSPRGKHQIRVCLGTACHVRGGQRVVDRLADDLGIAPGECTPDRNFSLEVVRCLGCCALAPVLVVGENIHKHLKVDKLGAIIKKYE